MTKEKSKIKAFNMRLPKETWVFLKDTAARQERSMTEIIVSCVEKYKKRIENNLTSDDTYV